MPKEFTGTIGGSVAFAVGGIRELWDSKAPNREFHCPFVQEEHANASLAPTQLAGPELHCMSAQQPRLPLNTYSQSAVRHLYSKGKIRRRVTTIPMRIGVAPAQPRIVRSHLRFHLPSSERFPDNRARLILSRGVQYRRSANCVSWTIREIVIPRPPEAQGRNRRMPKKTVGQLLVETLIAAGVKRIYRLCGDSLTVLPIVFAPIASSVGFRSGTRKLQPLPRFARILVWVLCYDGL